MDYASDVYAHTLLGPLLPKIDHRKAMLDATPDCIKIISLDGRVVLMNRAGCLALGVPLDSSFGMSWVPLLTEDVHAAANDALARCHSGQSARFSGKSIGPDGLMHWDNLLTPVFDEDNQVTAVLCVSRDITAKTLLEISVAEGFEREKLLAREMQHRIKNVFSVVAGLIKVAQREAAEADRPEAIAQILREKLHALARASDAVFVPDGGHDYDAQPVELSSIVSSVLHPYGVQCECSGQCVPVARSAVTYLALFLHELATNSMKYGALSQSEGIVRVTWDTDPSSVKLKWIEIGGPTLTQVPIKRGFGTDMADRAIGSLRGNIDRRWGAQGLVVDLRLPRHVLSTTVASEAPVRMVS